MRTVSNILIGALCCLLVGRGHGFAVRSTSVAAPSSSARPNSCFAPSVSRQEDTAVGCGAGARPPLAAGPRSRRRLQAAPVDVDTIRLVVGQETYGLAVVSLGEAVWSFSQLPSLSNLKVLLPGLLAAVALAAGAGPLVTSGDVGAIGTGLAIATAVSVALGVTYAARVAAPFGEPAKGIAFLGLLFAVAGFFSFSQNLVVDGFVTLPHIPLPSLPMPQGDGGVDYDAIMSMQDEAPVLAEPPQSIDKQ